MSGTGTAERDARATERPALGEWRTALSEDERAIFDRAGYGADFEPGSAPALLIVDTTINFTDETPTPIHESIERYPNSCGLVAWDALQAIAVLARAARDQGVPVVYTQGPVVKNSMTLGGWRQTKSRAVETTVDERGEGFVDLIKPEPSDLVIEKLRPSAFFGTALASVLTGLGRDTVIVCGTATSGCVRASVVDSFSSGFTTIVVEEGTFDRARTSHLVNLFEMNQKYAQVWTLEQATQYLASLNAAVARSGGKRP